MCIQAQNRSGEQIFWSWFRPIDRLAQVGFIVVTVGNRGGHPGRSKWYHNYGYGNLRDYGLADKKAAIEQLADRYDFIDIEPCRYSWSLGWWLYEYGGYAGVS